MADNNPKSSPRSTEPAAAGAELFLHRLRTEIWPRHGSKILAAIALVVLAGFLLLQNRQSQAKREAELAEMLGQAMDHLYNTRNDSAQTILEGFLTEQHPKGLQSAKASLLLGNLYFQGGRWDDASTQFQATITNSGSSLILRSGAEHGLAAVAIERGQYEDAASLLQKFIKEYGHRTGKLQDRYAGKEPVDVIALVPDAMWKLALCQVELQRPDDAKATAQRIVQVYGESRQATQARKLLASL